MLERRRKARYGSVSEGATEDVELGIPHGGHGDRDGNDDGEGMGPQESGVMNLEREVDNWDENAADHWDSADDDELMHGRPSESHGQAVVNGEGVGHGDQKKD